MTSCVSSDEDCSFIDENSISYEENDCLVQEVTEYIESASCEPKDEETVFVVLPNGTLLDPRVTRQAADVIIKHFDAIENGDLRGFWSTLMGQDGADINYHAWLILRYFSDMVNIEPEALEEIFTSGVLPINIHETMFHPEFPQPIPRNTGLFVKRIE